MAEEKPGSNFVFSVGKDSRRDDNFVTDNPADWMTTSINLWADVFDDDAPLTIGRRQWQAAPQKSTVLRIDRRNAESGRTANARGSPIE